MRTYLASGGLEHDAFALALGVEIDVGPVFELVVWIYVQDFDHVTHQVGQLVVQLDLSDGNRSHF